jgi:ankyrin repeat protein
MAADHQRLAVIDELVATGTPVDEEDEVFRRHPLRLAAANGRPASVEVLLRHGADPGAPDGSGTTPLEHCRAARSGTPTPEGHDAVEAILLAAIADR